MITVNHIKENDLWEVATIHKNVFKGHYLAQLPTSLLVKFYHSFLTTKEKSVFLVAKDNEKMCGFVLGGDKHLLENAKNNFIKQNFISLSFYSVIYALKFIIKKIFTRTQYTPTGETLPMPPSFRLLSIGVIKEMQGSGVASLLVETYSKHIPPHVKVYGLSVHKNNERAIGFYKKMGFQIHGSNSESFFLAKILR